VNLKIVSIADLGHRKDELGGPQLQHVQFQEADIRETGFASARGLIRDQLANARNVEWAVLPHYLTDPQVSQPDTPVGE